MSWVSRGWVGVKNIWKTHHSIIKVCFLIIFIACVPIGRISIVLVHDDDVPLLVTGERDNTNESDVGESGSEDENEALFEAAVDEESENEDIPTVVIIASNLPLVTSRIN